MNYRSNLMIEFYQLELFRIRIVFINHPKNRRMFSLGPDFNLGLFVIRRLAAIVDIEMDIVLLIFLNHAFKIFNCDVLVEFGAVLLEGYPYSLGFEFAHAKQELCDVCNGVIIVEIDLNGSDEAVLLFLFPHNVGVYFFFLHHHLFLLIASR